MAAFGPRIAKFVQYCKDVGSNFAGPITAQESIDLMLKVVEQATVEKDGGKFVSQFGNNIWL